MKLTERRIIVAVTAIYILSHGWLLINRGIYWDGWTIYGQSKAVLYEQFLSAGMPWVGCAHYYIQSIIPDIMLYKAITFICYLLSALLLNGILREVTEIDKPSRFFVLAIFAVFPVNSARIEIINVFYAISYAQFFLAFYILQKYLQHKVLALRIISVILFLFSFITNSLVAFFMLVLIYIVYSEKKAALFKLDLKAIVRVLSRYADFMIAPLIFWAVKTVYLKPTGVWSGRNYNQISLSLENIFGVLYSFNSSFIDVLWRSVKILANTSLLSVSLPTVTAIAIVVYYVVARDSITRENKAFNKYFLVLGIISFVIGVFPYTVVGKPPALYDWQSRHQLLVPLGASFMLVFALGSIKWLGNRSMALILSFLVALFTIANIKYYIDYEFDWYKQVSLVENFKENRIIKNHSTFLVEDNTTEFNANGRVYRRYEYSGLFYQAYKDETRLACQSATDVSEYVSSDLFTVYSKLQRLKQYRRSDPEFTIKLELSESGRRVISSKMSEFIRFKYAELFRENEFREMAKALIYIRTEQVRQD